jgi:hypothetical protein
MYVVFTVPIGKKITYCLEELLSTLVFDKDNS